MIRLDPRDIRIDHFTDDCGKELDNPQVNVQLRDLYPGESTITADRHHARFEVTSVSVPSKPSRRVTLSGNVTVTVGESEKEIVEKDLPLEVGRSIKIGQTEMKISTVRAFTNGQTGMIVGFESDTPLDAVKSVSFIDRAGELIPATQQDTFVPPGQQEKRGRLTYALLRELDAVTIRVRWFDQAKPIEVPFKIETGIGLGTATSSALEQSRTFSLPPTQVVYEERAAEAASILKDPAPGYFAATVSGNQGKQIALYSPSCWQSLARDGGIKPLPEAACVFLHELSAGGHKRVVALLRGKPAGTVPFDVVVFDATAEGPPQRLHRELSIVGPMELSAPSISRPDLTLFAAQVDPMDESHFTLNFLYGQTRGQIHGHLANDGLTVRIEPAEGTTIH